MTTGKTIALIRWTFVGKLMSLLFNMLSRLVIGEGNGTPLQYFCLENPMDGGAWWAAVYGVAQSRTRLKQLSSSSNLDSIFKSRDIILPTKVHLVKTMVFPVVMYGCELLLLNHFSRVRLCATP